MPLPEDALKPLTPQEEARLDEALEAEGEVERVLRVSIARDARMQAILDKIEQGVIELATEAKPFLVAGVEGLAKALTAVAVERVERGVKRL